MIGELQATADMVLVTPPVLVNAARGVMKHGMSWYDATIWAAARQGRCAVIYTEDLQSAPEIEGIRYVNPFAPNPAPAS